MSIFAPFGGTIAWRAALKLFTPRLPPRRFPSPWNSKKNPVTTPRASPTSSQPQPNLSTASNKPLNDKGQAPNRLTPGIPN